MPIGVSGATRRSGALVSVDADQATLYNDVLYGGLPAAAQRYLEELMASRTYEYQSPYVRNYVFQGRAEGGASALFVVLDACGIDGSDEARPASTAAQT